MSVSQINSLPAEDDIVPRPDYVPMLMGRTPDEIARVRARVLASSPEPRPLPPGKTLEDVIVGEWPGDETDDEIDAALKDLS